MQKNILVINPQTRSADRPSLTRTCDCGSGKLYKSCHGASGGHGLLIKYNEAFCLPTSGGGGNYIVVYE
jgi:hypothetical protein